MITTIKKQPKNFEEAIQSLEKITNLMQQNNLTLDQAIEYYDIGKNLVEFCKKKLLTAEQKLKILENNQLQDFKLDNQKK